MRLTSSRNDADKELSDHHLDEVLIDADEAANVAAGDAGDGLYCTSHHQDGTLNVLHVKVLLLTVNVVGSWKDVALERASLKNNDPKYISG